MRERIPSLLLLFAGSMLLLAPLTVRGQQRPTQLWNTTWGGTDTARGRGVAVGSDIYIGGNTESFGAGGFDAFLVKYGFPPVGGVGYPLGADYLVYLALVVSLAVQLVLAKKLR